MRKFIVICFISVFLLLSCFDDKITEEEILRKQQLSNNISNMISKYNAITEWDTLSDPIFTIELENCMVNTNDRPIYFEGFVHDISKKDDAYRISFVTYNMELNDITIILICDEVKAQNLLHINKNNLEDLAVIAHITKITKVPFSINIEFEIIDDDFNYSFPYLDFNYSGEFIAFGELIDFIHLK